MNDKETEVQARTMQDRAVQAYIVTTCPEYSVSHQKFECQGLAGLLINKGIFLPLIFLVCIKIHADV